MRCYTKILAWAGVVGLVCVLSAPAAANLLSNASFEDELPNGWVGAYPRTTGAGVWNPSPLFHDGIARLESNTGFGNYNATGSQTVALPFGPGNLVSFSGWGAVGPGAVDTNNRVIINVYDGANLALTGTIANGTHASETWHEVSGSFVPTTGSVTVEYILSGEVGWNAPGASHTDDYELTQIPEPLNLAVFTLAGLPLLLRRRRCA